jgi:glyoxylate reductase
MKTLKKTIFITKQIPDAGLELLHKKEYNVVVRKKKSIITQRELLKETKKVDALMCMLTDPVNRDVIESMEHCKVISTYAVGFNNIDVAAATEKGITVTNTPGVLTDATADIAFGLLLAAARHFITGDEMTRKGKFIGWDPMLLLGKPVAGKTIGIIGAGRIGCAVAERAAGFGMKILYYSRTQKHELEKKVQARKVGLKTLLKQSDFVSLHCPLNPDTYHLLGEEQLKLMKTSSVLINTARGEVVDEKALARALRKKVIFAAGLDVYEREPKVERALLALPNVVLLPHVGSGTDETRERMARMAANNIIGILEGSGKVYRVNKV